MSQPTKPLIDEENTVTKMANPVQSSNSFIAVDLGQSVKHPLVLFTVAVCTVLQHQPGLCHPDRVGYGECKDSWVEISEHCESKTENFYRDI